MLTGSLKLYTERSIYSQNCVQVNLFRGHTLRGYKEYQTQDENIILF